MNKASFSRAVTPAPTFRSAIAQAYCEEVVARENSRMPNYYDNRYWTMWKLPMFGATDSRSVLAEIQECNRSNPQSFIRVLGFDNIKQVQCMGFLVAKPY